MKEGDTPSFKSPLRCADREAFRLRTSFLAGDCGLPLPGADEGRTQSPQPRRFARPSPLGEGRKRHSRQGGLAAAAPVSLRGDGMARTPSQYAQTAGSRIQVRRLPHLRKCPFLACISQISTTTGWIKGGEKSPPLPFQLGGFQRGGRNRNLPPFGVISLFVHFLVGKRT